MPPRRPSGWRETSPAGGDLQRCPPILCSMYHLYNTRCTRRKSLGAGDAGSAAAGQSSYAPHSLRRSTANQAPRWGNALGLRRDSGKPHKYVLDMPAELHPNSLLLRGKGTPLAGCCGVERHRELVVSINGSRCTAAVGSQQQLLLCASCSNVNRAVGQALLPLPPPALQPEGMSRQAAAPAA